MKVVFGSHTFFSPVFVVGSHHLARAAARSGHSVWHVSSAFSLLHLPFALARQDYRARARLAGTDGRAVEPNLWESVPLTLAPWPLWRRAAERWPEWPRAATPEAGYLLSVRSLRRQAKRLGFERPDLLLIDEPRMASLIPLLEPRVTIYRPTDVYRDLKGDPSLVGVEQRLLPQVDGVIGTSAVVLEHVQSLRQGVPSLLLENGVDVDHFATPRPEPPELAGLAHPRAIYVGALDHRFDDALLQAAARENPAISFIVIGGAEARRGPLPNIHQLGRRTYEDVPAYLQHSDMAVMPLTAVPANEGRSPMKIFEFGAAGLSVVASSSAELRRRALPFVHLAQSPEEFSAACRQVAGQERGQHGEVARRSAAEHAWQGKAKRLFDFVSSLEARRTTPWPKSMPLSPRPSTP
jgi:glycosyltransferase involved in cell wall biosynthesis